MEKKEEIRKLIHDAVSNCCMRDATTSAWLASPDEAEDIIFNALLPVADGIPTDKNRLSGTLKELADASARFRALVSYAEGVTKEVKVSDVELDVVRCKAKLGLLAWFKEFELSTNVEVCVDEVIEENKRQLEALEKVCI